MKKLLISALALVSLVSCSKEEVVDQKLTGAEIAFEQAFVDNSTRAAVDPSITKNTLTAFDVWGFMDNTQGYVFQQQRVNGTVGGDWTYNPTQYWLPGHMYYFGALAPVNSNNWTLDTQDANTYGVGKVSFTNVNGKEDLLYAATSVSTIGKTVNDSYDKVAFTFNHLLSKVKFSFTNRFLASNYSIKVSNIKMNVPGDATINLNVENWWDNQNDWVLGNTTTVLEFGNMYDDMRLGAGLNAESDFERFTIPASADQSYTVTFDVELYVGDVSAYKNSLSTTITGAALEIGKAYNFHADLDETNVAGNALKPIEFKVTEVKEWEDGNGHEGNVIDTEVVSVADATELEAAVRAGAPAIRLVKNIETDQHFVYQPVTKATVNEYVLDLNGYTLKGGKQDSPQMTGEDIAAIVVKGGAKLTVNGNVNSSIEGTEYGIYVKDGVANINGGNIVAGTSAVQVYNGTANIYGGNFSANKSDVYVINCIDASWTSEAAKVNIYGGTFGNNFNPANNAAEANGTNFVAPGYISVQEGDNFVVYPKGKLQEVATEAQLQNALNAGGDNIVLTRDINLAAPLHVYSNSVVNLNGKNLSINRVGNEQNYVFAVFEGGNLTINGQGNVSAGAAKYSIAVWAYGGDVVINGGNYTNAGEGSDLILADKGSVVTINGGVFKACEKQDGVEGTSQKYSVLNCKDRSNSTFVVYGGTFFGFDPANNKSESPAVSFVADGYKSYAVDSEWFAVVKE